MSDEQPLVSRLIRHYLPMVSSPFEAWGKAMEKLTTPKANHSLCNANHGGGQK
ncbi:MAG: hypothetical protein KAG66_06445 [Methylococcales bacterium]|nr:hypothetical protein [Methylococcales bacterium]